jgi:hypothetical protein
MKADGDISGVSDPLQALTKDDPSESFKLLSARQSQALKFIFKNKFDLACAANHLRK